MAEALLRKYAGDRFEVYSAGLEPKGINPFTIQVMDEWGIDLSEHSSKDLQQYLGKVHFAYLITVCDNAEERCPFFPGTGTRMHWSFEDPAAFKAAMREARQVPQVRDQIDARIRSWLEAMDIPIPG